MPRWTDDPRMWDEPPSVCQHLYYFSAPWNFTREDQCYSWPGYSASGGKGREVNSHSCSSQCVFRGRHGTPEPASHGADKPKFLRQGPKYEHLFMALTSPNPSIVAFLLSPSVNWWSLLCAGVSASSRVCLRTYPLSPCMISELSDRVRGFDGSYF